MRYCLSMLLFVLVSPAFTGCAKDHSGFPGGQLDETAYYPMYYSNMPQRASASSSSADAGVHGFPEGHPLAPKPSYEATTDDTMHMSSMSDH